MALHGPLGYRLKEKSSPRSFNRQTFNWKKRSSNDRHWERPLPRDHCFRQVPLPLLPNPAEIREQLLIGYFESR